MKRNESISFLSPCAVKKVSEINYINIFSGDKAFFRPFSKIHIDIFIHPKCIPCKCIEIICFHNSLRKESRLYLAFDEVLNRINKHECEAKAQKLVENALEIGKTIDVETCKRSVEINMIVHYILSRLKVANSDEFQMQIVRLLADSIANPKVPNDVEWNYSKIVYNHVNAAEISENTESDENPVVSRQPSKKQVIKKSKNT